MRRTAVAQEPVAAPVVPFRYRDGRERGVGGIPLGTAADIVDADHPWADAIAEQGQAGLVEYREKKVAPALAKVAAAEARVRDDAKKRRDRLFIASTSEVERTGKKLVLPTAEREAKGDLVHGDHVIERGEDWKGPRAVAVRPIDRYVRDGHIIRAQHKAAEKLLADWIAGEGSHRMTALYGERADRTGEMSDAQAIRHKSYVEAMQALGPELSPVIVHVVLLEGSATSWAEQRGRRGPRAKEHGMTALCLGLDRLARHYRLT